MAKRLYDLVNDATEELRDYILANPDEPESSYDDTIFELADGAVPVYTSDLLDIASNDNWLAVDTPDTYAGGPMNPVDWISRNIYEHVSNELRSKLDELRDDLTPECDSCGTRTLADKLQEAGAGGSYCENCYQDWLEEHEQ